MGLLEDPRIRVVAVSLAVTGVILGARVVAYILSGSLAVLADALHSASDIGAGVLAITTLALARLPPDEKHPKGHERVEIVGAVAVGGILVILFLYILYESATRVLRGGAAIEASPLIAGILLSTMILDLWRSRALERASKEHGSMVVAADALHYSSDVYATSIALVVVLAAYFKLASMPVLIIFDAIAGSLIALYFAYAGLKVIALASEEVLEGVPPGLRREAEITCDKFGARLKGLRVERAGARVFVDLGVSLKQGSDPGVLEAIGSEIAGYIREVLPLSIVSVAVSPYKELSGRVVEEATRIASSHPGVIGVHDVRLEETGWGASIELHVETPESPGLDKSLIERELENKIVEGIPGIERARVIVEPRRLSPGDINRLIDKCIEVHADLVGGAKPKTVIVVQDPVKGAKVTVKMKALGGPPENDVADHLKRELEERLGRLCEVRVVVE